jgi:O-antigen/teichoic acid export membrane protein
MLRTLKHLLRSLFRWLPKGSTPAVLARASSAALVFLATLFWARALTPEQFGAYSLAFTTLALVSAITLLGLDQLTSRELAVLLHRQDWRHVWGFVRWAAIVAVATSILGAIVAGVVLYLNPMGWGSESRLASLWILVATPAVVFLRATRGAVQAADLTAKGLFWELTFWNGLIVLAGAAFWLSSTAADASTAAMVHAGTAFLAAGLAVVALLRLGWPRAAPTTEHHATWIKAGFGFAMFAAVGLLMQQADLLLLGAIGSQEEVGLYSIASRSAMLVLIVLGPINQVMGPRLAKAWSSGEPDRAAAIARRAAQLGMVAGAGLLAFFFVFGGVFLSLFGHEYTEAAWTLRILALAQLSLLVLGPGSMALVMSGKERLAALLHAVALVGGLPLGYVLYQSHGIEGMAWGRLVILAVAGLLTGILGYKRIGKRIDPWAR